VSEYASEKEARRHADTITRYWADRGAVINAWVERAEIPSEEHIAPVYQVRTDLLRGMPRPEAWMSNMPSSFTSAVERRRRLKLRMASEREDGFYSARVP
jgi:hypothetical protein